MRLLVKRGLNSAAMIQDFLNPRLSNLDDPFKIAGMNRCISRLIEAIEGGQKILVLGDYDVDGVTSTTLFVLILRHFGSHPRYLVPRRLDEGYGLSIQALERAMEFEKPDLFVALDCGTNSIEEISYLKNQGIDVIVVDHHQCTIDPNLQDEFTLINPHSSENSSLAWKNMCTVGLVFKVVHALIKELRKQGNSIAHELKIKDFLDLVALGTIADMVPLQQENRTLARYGMDQLRSSKNAGIQALCESSGIHESRVLQTSDVSFKLCPRINASGRLADAALPVQMLLETNPVKCKEYANKLNQLNLDRRKIESTIAQEAENLVEEGMTSMRGIVAYSSDWHPGVVGIVAGKLCRQYNKPAIVLGQDGDYAQGSARSVGKVDLVAVMNECKDHLVRWGGHPMAVGLTLEAGQVDAFRESFSIAIKKLYGPRLPPPSLEVEAWIDIEDLGEDLLDLLDLMQPFGQTNREPIFGIRSVQLPFNPNPFGKDHFRFHLYNSSGDRLQGIAWKMVDYMPKMGQKIDIVFRFAWNEWNGNRYPQITLLDWRLSDSN